jgi:hypothetical protein
MASRYPADRGRVNAPAGVAQMRAIAVIDSGQTLSFDPTTVVDVDGAAAMLDTVDAAQVVRVAAGGDWVLTQTPTKLLHRSGKVHGTFASPPLDAGQPAQWGDSTLVGELIQSGGCALRFRSGATATPDETWSAWTDVKRLDLDLPLVVERNVVHWFDPPANSPRVGPGRMTTVHSSGTPLAGRVDRVRISKFSFSSALATSL